MATYNINFVKKKTQKKLIVRHRTDSVMHQEDFVHYLCDFHWQFTERHFI